MAKRGKTSMLMLTHWGLLCVALPGFQCSAEDGSGLVIEAIGCTRMYPREGEKVVLRARLLNSGKSPIKGLSVRFLDTPPEGKEIPAGGEVRVEELRSGERKVVESEWTVGQNGFHRIRVDAKEGGSSASSVLTLPVVTKRLYFVLAFGTAAWIPNCNVVMTAGVPKKAVPEMMFRGARLCRWKGFNHRHTAEQVAEYLAKDLDTFPDRAIMIDEIGAYDQRRIIPGLEGLAKFKKENPEVFTTVFVAGSLKPLQCFYMRRGADLLLLESYFSWQVPLFKSYSRYEYFDQRIRTARDYDLLHKCLITLGLDMGPGHKDPYGQSPDDLEDQFRYLKFNVPEMPGISFYGAYIESLSRRANELIMKYYVKPVVTVWDRDIVPSDHGPVKKEEVTITASIHSIGGMDARDVRLRFYAQNEKGRRRRIGKEMVLPLVRSGPAKGLVKLPTDLVSERRVEPANGVPAGKHRVKVKWRPRKAGYYTIICQLSPKKGNYTILQGEAKRKLLVLE